MTRRRNPFVILDQPAAANLAASLRKRNRQWEKEHQNQKAVYRGVDPKLALKVKSIAGDLLVPCGEVAGGVIEYALRGYALGELEVYPRPNPYRMRMTLFVRTRPSKQKQPEGLWRVITTWRSFPPGLKRELAALASNDGLNVPVGELITALLRYGLKAYDNGLLNLEPAQKGATCNLKQDGRK
jgi:hypothetical protein